MKRKSVIFPPMRFSSLPRSAGEGWGGGEPVAMIQRLGSLAPLPTSPRKRGEVQKTEAW